ncbi:hypothetical protein [Streptomyces sp. NPDC003717]|uniref:hypothetical protein n=1 Tax=Streptomyces sp. NPDC003717 TaxID=3154276 RepID=UPI0033A5F5ED
MPHPYPSARICRNCDGQSTAVVTTGGRHPDGTRATLTVVCPSCQGTGHTIPSGRLAGAGR